MVDDTLVSLDRYSGVISKDREKKQLAVKAGTRVRDVVKALLLPPNPPTTLRALPGSYPRTFTAPGKTGALSASPS